MKGFLAAALLVAVASAALAQNPIGSWTGKVDLSGVHPADAVGKAKLKSVHRLFDSASMSLTFRTDKSYSALVTGITGMHLETKPDVGKWSQKGNIVTMVDSTGRSKSLTVTKDGKKMILTPPIGPASPSGVKIVFVRG